MAERAPYLSIGVNPGAIPALDGLRGIAILLVLLRHAARPIYEQHGYILRIGSWDIAWPMLNGWAGVDLFFVLSGFLITHHLLRRWPAAPNSSFFLRYWAKRVLRTFPAFYAAVLIAIFGVIPDFHPPVDDMGYALSVHALFLQDYLGSELVPAFWSLGVEEKFYILCPFLLWSLRGLRLRGKIIALCGLAVMPAILRIVTVFAGDAQLLNYTAFFWTARAPFHLAMDGLWIGVICAFINKQRRDSDAPADDALAKRLSRTGLLMLAAILLPIAWFESGRYLSSVLVISAVSMAFGLILLAECLGTTALTRWLKARWLRVMSVLSYSVYLMHLMLEPLALRLVAHGDAPAWQQFAYYLPTFVVLSLAAGLALHLGVEKPFLNLKDRIQLEPRVKQQRPRPGYASD